MRRLPRPTGTKRLAQTALGNSVWGQRLGTAFGDNHKPDVISPSLIPFVFSRLLHSLTLWLSPNVPLDWSRTMRCTWMSPPKQAKTSQIYWSGLLSFRKSCGCSKPRTRPENNYSTLLMAAKRFLAFTFQRLMPLVSAKHPQTPKKIMLLQQEILQSK